MRYRALAALLLVLFVLAWQGVASLHSVDDLTLASPVETSTPCATTGRCSWTTRGVTLVEVLLGLRSRRCSA